MKPQLGVLRLDSCVGELVQSEIKPIPCANQFTYQWMQLHGQLCPQPHLSHVPVGIVAHPSPAQPSL